MFISTTKLKDQVLYNSPDPDNGKEKADGDNDGGRRRWRKRSWS